MQYRYQSNLAKLSFEMYCYLNGLRSVTYLKYVLSLHLGNRVCYKHSLLKNDILKYLNVMSEEQWHQWKATLSACFGLFWTNGRFTVRLKINLGTNVRNCFPKPDHQAIPWTNHNGFSINSEVLWNENAPMYVHFCWSKSRLRKFKSAQIGISRLLCAGVGLTLNLFKKFK